MVQLDMVPKLVETFKRSRGPLAELALTMLYQLSTEPPARASFRYTECIPLVVELIAQQTEPSADRTCVGNFSTRVNILTLSGVWFAQGYSSCHQPGFAPWDC